MDILRRDDPLREQSIAWNAGEQVSVVGHIKMTNQHGRDMISKMLVELDESNRRRRRETIQQLMRSKNIRPNWRDAIRDSNPRR